VKHRQRRPAAEVPRRITSLADVQAGLTALKRSCPAIRRAHAVAGDPPLRLSPAGFAGLVRIVVGQQVSVASAAAIWARVQAQIVPLTPEHVATLSDADLRAPGLSGPKVRTVQQVARAAGNGLDFETLAQLPAALARERLLAIPGIGPWSADLYLMFCLGHADVFAPGDLALRAATADVLDLASLPSADELAVIAERWRPWRAIAARQLWSFYAARKAQGDRAPV
jgi:DNA-3-methyladenine glycosylase II